MKNKQNAKHTAYFLSKQKAQQDRFLEAFARLGRQNAACKETGVSQGAVWEWRRDDPKFEARYNDADGQVGVMLEDEAIRRAVEGVKRGVYHNGERVGEETEYSDALLKVVLGTRNRRYKNATEEFINQAPPNVTVTFYGNPPSQTNNDTAQLRTTPLPTPDIKSYR